MRKQGNCKKHRIYVHPDAPPVDVEAAFNGLAIFSAASLTSPRAARCRYTNQTEDRDSGRMHVVSEHVPYQQCLRASGIRIAIVPSLLTYCHDWSTRYDARRTYYLRNGSVTRLLNRHAKPHPGWAAGGGARWSR